MVESYSDMVGYCLMPAYDLLGAHLKWFMKDNAPFQYARSVNHGLDQIEDPWNGHQT
jgi:hypothetical protein